MNVFSFLEKNKYFHSVKDEMFHSHRWMENISSFTEWKYLYHCTQKTVIICILCALTKKTELRHIALVHRDKISKTTIHHWLMFVWVDTHCFSASWQGQQNNNTPLAHICLFELRHIALMHRGKVSKITIHHWFIFVCLICCSVRRHTWVLMGPDLNKNA